MGSSSFITFFLAASIASLSFTGASPVQHARAVTELNQEAFKEAHTRDAGATRAFEGVEIKTADGKCLAIDELSGDFRANLTPVQVAACGGKGQSWDIITSGAHNNVAGKMLVVNTLTQACLDFNQNRVNRETTAFSCGGRAGGEGIVSVDQLFPVPVNPAAFPLNTDRGLEKNKCVGVVGNALGLVDCVNGAAAQTFSIGGKAGADGNAPVVAPPVGQTPPAVEAPVVEAPVVEAPVVSSSSSSSSAAVLQPSTTTAILATTQAPPAATAEPDCELTTLVTVVATSTITVTESFGAAVKATSEGFPVTVASEKVASPTYYMV